jgi:outer membrane lipoprotein-sorting protein
MKAGCLRLTYGLALLLPLPLSGCFVLSTTRKLPVPKPPQIVYTVSAERLVAKVNERWASISSLNATVDIQASVLKSKQGVAKDYTTFRAIILMRKPQMLRVYGRVPVIGTKMFDMVSDGKNFTLSIPSRNKVVKGPNELKKKSASQVENMRPGFFFDAMMVRGLEPDDLYAVVSESETVEDAAKKHLFAVPEYVLSIMRRKEGSQQLTPVRVVTFHRDDLLPYQQDLYSDDGSLETEVFYSQYADYGTSKFPSKVTIKRPLEEYQIVMTVEKVTENMKLTDDQFEIKIPDGTTIQNLE